MGLSYGRKKFHAATRTLVSSLPLHQRINDAFTNFLVYLTAEDLPAEAVPEFNSLMKKVELKKTGPDEEFSFRIGLLSSHQLEAVAERIIALYTVLCEAYERKKVLEYR